MFRRTDRQIPLLGATTELVSSAQARLKQSWAEPFHKQVMPLLLEVESRFAVLYAREGRPNWSVARLLGISLLQQFQALDDQSALDAFSFDLRWRHALGLSSEDAYLSRRSLVEFRRRLVVHDPDGELLRGVFDRVFATAAEQLQVSTAQQRLDSTLVCSNIRAMGRLSLAKETLRVFLHSLKEPQRQLLPEEIRLWEAGAEGWEPPSEVERKAQLKQVARWMRQLIELFAGEEAVRTSEPYQLMERMLREHRQAIGLEEQDPARARASSKDEPPSQGAQVEATVETEVAPSQGAQVEATVETEVAPSQGAQAAPVMEAVAAAETEATAEAVAAAETEATAEAAAPQAAKTEDDTQGKPRYWSPHDPDASYGHKGLGYHIHIAETCGNQGTELLTDYGVVTAAESDVGQAGPVVARLQQRERAPEILYADGGYPTPAELVDLPAQGTELYAPVHRGRMPETAYTREDFPKDEHGQVVSCPQGHAPTRHAERTSSDTARPRRTLNVFFDAEVCRACPQLSDCPVRTPNNAKSKEYRLDMADELRARDRRFAEQQTEEWQQRYQIRCGIEATMSELKRAHGLERLRVRGQQRVLVQVALKATACNIKRWLRAVRAAVVGRPGAPQGSWMLLETLWAARQLQERMCRASRQRLAQFSA